MVFSIDASDLAWIRGEKDDPRDLCLHGRVTVCIGERKICYENCTVSASALCFLKTLTEDHLTGTDCFMLPHCGNFMVPDAALENVTIIGCDCGADFTVLHDGDDIVIALDDGTRETVPSDEYRREVFRFADKVEAFYAACSPKIPDDDSRDGYAAFLNEWHRRRYG